MVSPNERTDDEAFGPTIEDEDLPAKSVEQIEEVLDDLDKAGGPPTLH